MKFAVTAIISSLALANLGFAAPAEGLVQRDDDDWKTKYGWDGEVTLLDNVGRVVSSSKALTKRTQPGGIYFCPLNDWLPQPDLGCSFYVFPRPGCMILNPGTFGKALSSVGPDSGNHCILYTSTNCTNGSPSFTFPGFGRLEGSTWGEFHDNTGSIKCWW